MKRLIILCLLAISLNSFGQNASIKATRPEYKEYIDSLKEMDYPYTFPIWGEQVYKKGFDIPYPAGVMVNYVAARQEMIIDAIDIGINNSEMVDFSGLIEFSDIQSEVTTFNVRPDLYILPFWNVYGLLGYNWTQTRVVLSSPVAFETTASLQGALYGFGTNLAAGFGPVWGSADFNMVWADLDKLDQPVRAVNTSFRVGHTFVNYSEPEKNIAIWVGVFGTFLQGQTAGSINLNEVIPDDALQGVKDQLQGRYDDWYNELGPLQKPIVDQVVDQIQDRLDGIETTDVTVNYDLLKRPKANWNMIMGFQYQFNKKWQLRTEAGFYGARTQFLASLNYRFRI